MPKISNKVTSKGGGIGESRIFRAEDAAPPDIMKCHIGGELVGALVEQGRLNPAHIVWALTDEGIEARVAAAAHLAKPSVQFVRDETDKKLFEERKANLEDDLRFDAPKPDVELMKQYTPAGFVGCWMNDIAAKSLTTCGYEPAKDENGGRVTLGDMWLGIKPVEEHQKLMRRLNRHTEILEKEISEEFQSKVEEGYREAGVRPPRKSSSDPDQGVMDDTVL